MERVHLGIERTPQGCREPERQLRMGATADRYQDALDVRDAPLLDDRDVAGRLAHDLVDGGAEDRLVGNPRDGRVVVHPSRR